MSDASSHDDLTLASPVRPSYRHTVALMVIVVAVAQALGIALKAPVLYGANDISRWCTVWSLLERGTYIIDDCPWQGRTQDKVKRADPFQTLAEGEEPVEHYYSSKPPFLPTVIAGVLYPFRAATGVPLDQFVPQARIPRYVDKEIDGKTERVLETPENPVEWPVRVWYFNPIVVALNIVPLLLSLFLFAKLLDREAENDWAWFLSLMAAAFGTLLLPFLQTLNNHTVAAYAAFFALLALIRIYSEREPTPWPYIVCGFFGAFCACNELPAALFGIMLFVCAMIRSPRMALLAFVPAAAVPIAGFLVTQKLAFGQFRPVYEEFGTKSYKYEGSYWQTPLEMDWFNENPESRATYFFHMTFGHHGVFSLTPILLFSIYGAFKLAGRRGAMRPVAWLTLLLTVIMVAFYLWNPKARNYGGSTQGLRWLFWLIPFWLLTLPAGLEGAERSRFVRWASLAALGVSVLTVGYALQTPWSHPWLQDFMERFGLYTLQR